MTCEQSGNNECESAGCTVEPTVHVLEVAGRKSVHMHRLCDQHGYSVLSDLWSARIRGPGVSEVVDGGVRFDLAIVTHNRLPGRVGCWIVLRETGGFRNLTFHIGPVESWSLIAHVLGRQSSRLPVHFALIDLLRQIGGSVRRAVVDGFDSTANAYHSTLHMDVRGESLLVGATPGDTITTAVISDASVYIMEDVLTTIGKAAGCIS